MLIVLVASDNSVPCIVLNKRVDSTAFSCFSRSPEARSQRQEAEVQKARRLEARSQKQELAFLQWKVSSQWRLMHVHVIVGFPCATWLPNLALRGLRSSIKNVWRIYPKLFCK